MAMIFAEPGADRAYRAWRGKRSQRSVGLTGAELERTIMALAVTNPDLVRIQR